MRKRDQQWIDLLCLINFVGYEDGKVIYHYVIDDPDNYHTITYNLRKALRVLGHTIEKINNHIINNKLVQVSYQVSVTEQEQMYANKLYQEYMLNLED
jgi:hypothetical protein